MSFERAFRFFTYTTAFWAFLMLAIFSELHLPLIALFTAAFGACLLRKRFNLVIPNAAWLAISIIALGAALFGWFIVGEHFYSVVYLFLYLELNKLWTGTRDRDILQVYALTFFQMLAASVSTASVFFGFGLAVYLFLILGALITMTFKREADLAFAVRHEKKRKKGEEIPTSMTPEPVRLRNFERRRLNRLLEHRYLTPRLMSRLVSALFFILITGTCLFFIIPRLQGKAYVMGMGPSKSSRMSSGFSDSVNFFGMGEIQRDPTIVMRVFPQQDFPMTGGRPDMDFMKLRGTALDHFDGRSWNKSQEVHSEMKTQERRRSVELPLDAAYRYSERRYRVRVLMEPNAKGYLFGPDRPARFEFFPSEVDLITDDMSSSVQVSGYHWSVPLQYTVESRQPLVDWDSRHAAEVKAVEQMKSQQDPGEDVGQWRRRTIRSIFRQAARPDPEEERRQIEKHYLQLPETADIQRVVAAAREWTKHVSSQTEIARAVEHRLRNEYSYSMDVSFSSRADHLSHFLLERREGHCEYFATAMALMLRARGVPSRIVNGYATDEWMPSGTGFYVVRQEHAHSWVEAWFPHVGWVAYDPTPAAGLGANRLPMTFGRRISRLYDGLKFVWYDKVIDYGVKDQGSIFRFITRAVSAIPSTDQIFSSPLMIQLRSERNSGKVMAFSVIAVLLLGAAAFMSFVGFRKRKVRKAEKSGDAAWKIRSDKVREYLVLLDEVELHVSRPASHTPLEYARHVAAEREPLTDFVELTERYYGARFNDDLWTKAESERVNALLRRLREKSQTPR